MPDITITDAAVEAAIAALVARVFGGLAAPSPQALTLIREDLTAELAAAAPYIAAQALRDAAGSLDDADDDWEAFKNRRPEAPRGWTDESIHAALESSGVLTDWLRARADRIEATNG